MAHEPGNNPEHTQGPSPIERLPEELGLNLDDETKQLGREVSELMRLGMRDKFHPKLVAYQLKAGEQVKNKEDIRSFKRANIGHLVALARIYGNAGRTDDYFEDLDHALMHAEQYGETEAAAVIQAEMDRLKH